MRKNVTMKRKMIMRKDVPKRIVLRRETSKVEEVEEGTTKKEISKRIKRKGTSKKENENKQEAEGKQKVKQKLNALDKNEKQETVVIQKKVHQEAEDKQKAMPKNRNNQEINVFKKETIKSSNFFKDLFEKYSIIETSDIYEEFDLFKKSHLDKLTFFNEQMLETYRLAFFYKFYKLKIPKIKYCGKAKVTMFNNALDEIKLEPRSEEQPCDLICNLYSILHPINRNSS
jgi:flagellar biosynthesis GTPase FlhF